MGFRKRHWPNGQPLCSRQAKHCYLRSQASTDLANDRPAVTSGVLAYTVGRFLFAHRLQMRETARIEAFSDGVFAVAITLLVLNIKIPSATAGGPSLLVLLAGQWPTFLAFVTSFATILIMWVNHHRIFTHIGRSSEALLFFNGLLLFGVTFVPFSTALVAQYLNAPGKLTAAVVYNGTYVFIAVLYNLLWRTASQDGRLLRHDADLHGVAAIHSSFRWGIPIYTIAFALAFVSVTASLILNLLLAVFFALPGRVSAHNGHT